MGSSTTRLCFSLRFSGGANLAKIFVFFFSINLTSKTDRRTATLRFFGFEEEKKSRQSRIFRFYCSQRRLGQGFKILSSDLFEKLIPARPLTDFDEIKNPMTIQKAVSIIWWYKEGCNMGDYVHIN